MCFFLALNHLHPKGNHPSNFSSVEGAVLGELRTIKTQIDWYTPVALEVGYILLVHLVPCLMKTLLSSLNIDKSVWFVKIFILAIYRKEYLISLPSFLRPKLVYVLFYLLVAAPFKIILIFNIITIWDSNLLLYNPQSHSLPLNYESILLLW